MERTILFILHGSVGTVLLIIWTQRYKHILLSPNICFKKMIRRTDPVIFKNKVSSAKITAHFAQESISTAKIQII